MQADVLDAGGAVCELHGDLVDLIDGGCARSSSAAAPFTVGDATRAAGDGHGFRPACQVLDEWDDAHGAQYPERDGDGDSSGGFPAASAGDRLVDAAGLRLAGVAQHHGNRQRDREAGEEDAEVHADARPQAERPVLRAGLHRDWEEDERGEREAADDVVVVNELSVVLPRWREGRFIRGRAHGCLLCVVSRCVHRRWTTCGGRPPWSWRRTRSVERRPRRGRP